MPPDMPAWARPTPISTPSSTNSMSVVNPSTPVYQSRLRATSLTGSLT